MRPAPSSSRPSRARGSAWPSRSPRRATGIPATAVATEPLDDTSRALVELAERLDAPLTVEVWGDDIDLSLTDLLVEAAGPVVAWTT